MVAQLRSLGLVALTLLALGCQGGDEAATNKDMSTPSAANGPKIDDWAKANLDNGKPGHSEEK